MKRVMLFASLAVVFGFTFIACGNKTEAPKEETAVEETSASETAESTGDTTTVAATQSAPAATK